MVERLGRAIVEGPNFHFGRGRLGNVTLLQQLAKAAGRTLEIVEPVIIGDEPVSSSRVRRLIADGQVEQAPRTTAPYRIRGMVVHGGAVGPSSGFPLPIWTRLTHYFRGRASMAGRRGSGPKSCPPQST